MSKMLLDLFASISKIKNRSPHIIVIFYSEDENCMRITYGLISMICCIILSFIYREVTNTEISNDVLYLSYAIAFGAGFVSHGTVELKVVEEEEDDTTDN